MKTILAPLLLAVTACGTTHSGTDHDSHDTSGHVHDTETGTTASTGHDHATEPTSTGHAHTETGHDHTSSSTSSDTTTDTTTGGGSPIADYCECMLVNCHDQYHGTWGEEHPQSEENCSAAAAMWPTVGMPAISGDSLECRLYHCEQALVDASQCEAAIGGAPCA
ncbi:hypothetical protein [Nannocystis bainbridge]|uniref:Secreted protein n=1 Tax=Nannocystis bainbridge TaxID=2995303 RepID=A0ABT5DXR9_9BACT|nr:hypothetical protein [Nannocystis bainbridge]MDC0718365.1 hypothetical protein [Nannocystis bainbridge]